jgi:predicted transglutaminase-like cysteine proteinase
MSISQGIAARLASLARLACFGVGLVSAAPGVLSAAPLSVAASSAPTDGPNIGPMLRLAGLGSDVGQARGELSRSVASDTAKSLPFFPGWRWPVKPSIAARLPEAPADPEAEASASPPANVSGSVSIRISRSTPSARWAELLTEDVDRFLVDGCGPGEIPCGSPSFKRLAAAFDRTRGEPLESRIRRLNLAVNTAIRFTSDEDLYGRADHWATLEETVLSGRGDYEDFALVKMWVLRAAGIPPEALHLVLSKETRRQVDHAVLVVRVGQDNLVLDSLHRCREYGQRAVAVPAARLARLERHLDARLPHERPVNWLQGAPRPAGP